MKKTNKIQQNIVYIINDIPYEVCDPKEATLYFQDRKVFSSDEIELNSNTLIPLKPVNIEASLTSLRKELEKLGFVEFGCDSDGLVYREDGFSGPNLYVYPGQHGIAIEFSDVIEFNDINKILEFVNIYLSQNKYKEISSD